MSALMYLFITKRNTQNVNAMARYLFENAKKLHLDLLIFQLTKIDKQRLLIKVWGWK